MTGSRIRRLDLVTPAPVAVIGKEQIQESGLASVGQILQNLPSQSNGINIQTNNGGDGSTRINLRGLGTERTLVLVNGRRFVSGGTGANESVDLNAIPVSIIERIEVLKDGASAVYGSDAIGGVVNIITKKNFSGVEGSTYIGSGQVGGFVYDLSVTAGHTTEKGNILLSFSLYDNNDIFAGERNFSNPDTEFDYLSDLDMDGKPDCLPACGSDTADRIGTIGSSAIPQTYIRVRNDDTAGNAAWQAIQQQHMNPDASATAYINDPVDGWRAFRGTGTRDSGEGDQYNYQPENYLLTPSQRYSLVAIGSYDIFEDLVSVYGEASYTNRQSDQLLAPEAFFGDAEGIEVSDTNPYNPFGRPFNVVRRRFSEAGPRQFLQDLDTYRAVVGLNGGLPDGLGVLSEWRWDTSFTFGRTEGTEIKRGLLVRENVVRALGPGFIDTDGTARCGTADAPIDGCVPLDLFGGEGAITPDMLNYLTYTGTARGFTQQQVIDVGVVGPLFSLFDREISLSIGYQHRDEEGGFQPDPLTEAGNTTGNKGLATEGGFVANEVYGELGIPLHFDIPAVETLELTGALRFVTLSSDKTEINPDPQSASKLTWKGGLRWQLFEHVALRGSASRSFRAPSIGELFAGQQDSFPLATDPCSTITGNGDPHALSQNQIANCAREGVPTDLEDDRAQQLERVGGNVDLKPETADTFTGGIVITPKFGPYLDGLSVTVDYWSVAIDNAIDPYTATVILNNCYSVDPSVSRFCELISRDPDGYVDTITDLEANITGGIQTAGIDFGLQYRLPTDFGTFRYSFDGTWLQKYNAKYSDDIVIKGKGVYDLGVQSNFKFNNTLSYGIAGFTIGFNVRFINGFKECFLNICNEDQDFNGQPDDANGDGVVDENDPPKSRAIPSYTTADIFAGYRLAWDIGVTDIGVGINNVADKTPPFLDNGFTANSDADTYDYIGRYFYARLAHTF